MTRRQLSLSAAACSMILAFAASTAVIHADDTRCLTPVSDTTVQADDRQDHDRGGSPIDLARRWADAWNSHDANAVATLFTREAMYEDVPFGIVNRGPDQIQAFAEFFFTAVPDLHVSLVNNSLNDGHGTIEWVFSGTDHGIYGTGRTFSVRGVTVLDVRGAKISRNSDYFDLATVLRQLGLLPSGL